MAGQDFSPKETFSGFTPALVKQNLALGEGCDSLC